MKKICACCIALLALGGGLTGCKNNGAETSQNRVEYVRVGPNWEALYTLKPPKKSLYVKIKGKEQYKQGDPVSLAVTSEQAGKLWIVQVDSRDEATLLFPNDKQRDNTIEAVKPMTIPAPADNWRIEAAEPFGKSVVAAIVTTGDQDLSEILAENKSMDKALRVLDAAPAWGVNKIVIDIGK